MSRDRAHCLIHNIDIELTEKEFMQVFNGTKIVCPECLLIRKRKLSMIALGCYMLGSIFFFVGSAISMANL